MHDPTSILGRRYAAYVVNGIISAIIVVVLLLGVGGSMLDKHTIDSSQGTAQDYCSEQYPAGSGHTCFAFGQTAYVDNGGFTVTIWLGFLGWFAINDVLLEGLAGGNVGKLIMGLRVVRADGRRAGPGWCLLRNLLLIVDQACFALPGIISSSTSKGHRRIGDMAASTFVVARADEGKPLQIPGLTVAAGYYPYPPQPYQAPAYSGYPPAPASGPQPGAPPMAGSAPVPQPSGPGEPQWDAARNAYIQWDASQQAWLQWDDASQSWRPIS